MEPTALARYGLLLVFLNILLDQSGLPIPAVPILVACGALAARGEISLTSLLLTATAASMTADLAWYALGKWRGSHVLRIFCRYSLHAEERISGMQRSLRHHGLVSIGLAKFIPGIATIAPPMAGALGVSISRFLLVSSLSGLAWAGGSVGIGWLFRDTIAEVTRRLETFGVWALAFVGLLLFGYVSSVLWRRRKGRTLRYTMDSPPAAASAPTGGDSTS